jgi:valyl-tRNA synthetase
MGTIFGYTQFDAVARYQRMRGKQVFFPLGWDDNGLATERRVQNFYGVRCDPTQPFVRDFAPPFRGDVPRGTEELPISRPNFVDLCHELTATDEAVFEDVFRRLGMSVDWSLLYTTIGEASRRVSQVAFLHNLARGEAYSSDAPTVWDVDFQTAVAQAEIEDKERPGAYHTVAFHSGSSDVLIETSRPELIVSCVALVAHPDDARYQSRFDTTVRTPLFGVEVPVVAHPLADPEKGTGIAMVCTFGDVTDVTWWRELNLPTRSVIGRDGRFSATTPDWVSGGPGEQSYAALAGRTVKQAQAATVDALRESGDLIGEPKQITHPVKFYERGSRPLEIVTSRQWYIRNGGRDEDRRQELLARGKELAWYPDHMRHRYTHWVEGLNGDWLISRQRFFGVPIPLWYPVGDDGEVDYDHPLLPAEGTLPIDPSTDVPPAYSADQRDQPGGFTGDRDVMDTWATSSLTPQIAGGWVDDPDLFANVFPMDLRPQGPEIIRTWLFATVIRSHYEHESLPWPNAMINGWVLDADRKKMSKSVGNVVTPMGLFEQYGTDAVRHWSLSARPGVDTAVSEEQMKVGRRLATKLLNVTKFVLGIWAEGDPAERAEHEPVDAAMLAKLDGVIVEATAAFDGFDYARALERTEEFFWWFCDDYVELVKGRAYGSRGEPAATSAGVALRTALGALQRLLAPTLPFAAEEAWSWWHADSVHAASWPEPGTLQSDEAPSLDPVSDVLARVRRTKTEAKVSQRAAVATLDVRGPAEWIAAVEACRDDLTEALTVTTLTLDVADDIVIDVALA